MKTDSSDAHLGPPPARGGYSVVKLADYWYVACESSELGRTLITRTILGIPLVLFRDETGKASTFLDRCPHRNIPLSFGEVLVKSRRLQCGYHGWQFDGTGECRDVPGLCAEASARGRRAITYPTKELDGYVWVYMTPDTEPVREPFRFPLLDDPKYTTARRQATADGAMFHIVENALDVPHTAFLHGGLFRTAKKENEIEAVVRVYGNQVEAEYIGEPRPPGLAARILSPSGGVVTHFDRFLMPSITQVEYRIGTENHILVTSVMVPVTDFHTHLYAVVSFRTRLPGFLVRPVIEPVAQRIFQQDAEALAAQTDTLRNFQGESFVSTEIDVLGLHIWKMMKAAERGEASDEKGEPRSEQRLKLMV